ncbi:MAG: hypothetical protein E7B29_08905 [Mixta calida]|nr:hypothetical protein [Mixta calida]
MNTVVVDGLARYLNDEINKQPWYKRNANTITAVGGFIATLIAALATTPFAADPRFQLAVFVVGFILTIFGVKVTPNGFSRSQQSKIAAAHAAAIDSVPLAPENDARPKEEPAKVSLEDLIEKYRKGQ